MTPSTEHQRILANLAFKLIRYFRDNDRQCEVFLAPFDVRLIKNIQYYDESKIDCVVQPDIYCVGKSKLQLMRNSKKFAIEVKIYEVFRNYLLKKKVNNS